VKRVCSVRGCEEEAVKSISVEKIRESGINLELEAFGRRAWLCKKHYKEYKKARRKLDRLERMRWMTR